MDETVVKLHWDRCQVCLLGGMVKEDEKWVCDRCGWIYWLAVPIRPEGRKRARARRSLLPRRKNNH